MKKNTRVNISGLVFNMDEDAYDALQAYLNRLRNHFGAGSSTEEIIADIESRVADLFKEKDVSGHNIVSIEIVNQVIKLMGEPGEIDDEHQNEATSESEKSEEQKTHTHHYHYEQAKRRLYRDSEGKVVGGVAGGLAIYFNLDPIWVRLAFVLLTISGMSVLVYIILWIVIPEAKTTAQKLEMKGETINLENIEKTIKEEFDDLSNRFKDMKDKHFTKKKGELTIFERFIHFMMNIATTIFKFVLTLIGIFIAVIALVLIISLIPSFFNSNFLWFNQLPGLNFISFPVALNMIIENSKDINMLLTALGMVLFIPLIALVYQGIKLIFGIKHSSNVISIALLTIWITGLILLAYTATKVGNTFDSHAEINYEVPLDQFPGDTLYIHFQNPDSLSDLLPIINSYNGQYVFFGDQNFYYLNPTIETKALKKDENFTITIDQISRGKTYLDAQENASNISYSYTLRDSLVDLSAYSFWPKEDHYRTQHTIITIGIPQGKQVAFEPNEVNQLNDRESKLLLEKAMRTNKAMHYIYIDEYRDHIIFQSKDKRVEIKDAEIEID